MKELQPDDPRYTAYILGELPPKEAKIIAERAESDPAIASEMAKTQALGKLLCEAYEREGLSLHPVQRAVIRRVGQSQEAMAMRSARRRVDWYRGAGISLAAAASITIVLFLLAKTPVDSPQQAAAEPEELRMDVVLSPAALANWGGEEDAASGSMASVAKVARENEEPKEASSEKADDSRREFAERILSDPERFFVSAERTARSQILPTPDSFIPLQENEYLSTSESPSTTVPVMAGRTSFAWVERFLRERGQLPPKDAVRLEELVNYPDYQESAGAEVGGVALTSELVPCPWNSDSLLLGLLLQRQPGSAEREKVSVKLEIDEERVAEYRLLGFAQPDGEVVAGADASHPLAAGNSTYVFYEIRPGDVPFDDVPLGKIALKVTDGVGSPVYRSLEVPSIPNRWLDSSNSFRTAATVAAYALVLRDSPFKGNLSLAWVESLARQTLLEHPKANSATREVLELIIQTRSLAGLEPTA
ncbi:von Willebrand factor type A domain-containing protein [Roseibacillus persicicus]|uniref:VWA domain-containing protein n=1 Tax=Roseibacillus persicicus TaxID=454148 RepID=UPI00398ABA2C